MKRKFEILEFCKTVAVLVLMVALVCLCLIYMLSYQTAGQYAFTKDMMQTLGAESVKYQYADHIRSSYAAPKFIGFSAKEYGDDIGFHTLGGENAEVASSLLPFYEKLFSEEGEMRPLSEEEGSALFSAAMKGDHIYVVYETDIPKSLLYAMTAENAMLPATSREYLRELILFPDRYLYDGVSLRPTGMQVYTSIYTFGAVARDSEGNYYRYSTSFAASAPEDISFNTNYYLAYTTSDAYFSYVFAEESARDDAFFAKYLSRHVTDTTVIPTAYSGEYPFSRMSVSSLYPEEAVMNALMGTLLMNPEQATSFTDADGVKFYYEEGRNISISPSGHLEYTAYGEEGLPLSDLFEYHATNEAYDMQDYLGASLMLARSLEQALNAEHDCTLFLSDIDTAEDRITVTFGYAADGIPLYFDGYSGVLSLEFEAGMLKRVSYDLKEVRSADDTEADFDAAETLWLLRAAIAKSEEEQEYAYGYFFTQEREHSAAVICARDP